MRQCQSCLRVGQGVDLHHQAGGLDVAVLVEDAHVELELGPVGRQRLEHGPEVVGERHAARRLLGGTDHAHGLRELITERMPAPAGANCERSAEGLAPGQLDLVAGRDTAL